MPQETFSSGIRIKKSKRNGKNVRVEYFDGIKTIVGYPRYLIENKYGRLNPGYRIFRKSKGKALTVQNLFVAKSLECVRINCSYCHTLFFREASLVRAQEKKGTKDFYCSISCAARGRTKSTGLTEYTCNNCGKKIYRSTKCVEWFKKHKNNKNLFCSRECNIQWKTKQVKLSQNKCKYCGKQFTRELRQKSKEPQYCSFKCMSMHKHELAKVFVACGSCDKTLVKRKSDLRKRNGEIQEHFFCNKKCWLGYWSNKE